MGLVQHLSVSHVHSGAILGTGDTGKAGHAGIDKTMLTETSEARPERSTTALTESGFRETPGTYRSVNGTLRRQSVCILGLLTMA